MGWGKLSESQQVAESLMPFCILIRRTAPIDGTDETLGSLLLENDIFLTTEGGNLPENPRNSSEKSNFMVKK
jgi:hypothetical protein